jgi:hypothetical protein
VPSTAQVSFDRKVLAQKGSCDRSSIWSRRLEELIQNRQKKFGGYFILHLLCISKCFYD